MTDIRKDYPEYQGAPTDEAVAQFHSISKRVSVTVPLALFDKRTQFEILAELLANSGLWDLLTKNAAHREFVLKCFQRAQAEAFK